MERSFQSFRFISCFQEMVETLLCFKEYEIIVIGFILPLCLTYDAPIVRIYRYVYLSHF